MAIGEKIYARLAANASVATLVDTRIYPMVLPQNASYPAITYEFGGAERETAFGSDTGIVRGYLEVNVIAETYAGVKTLATHVRTTLQRWRDESSASVCDVFVENESDTWFFDQDRFAVTLDFEVIHRE